MPEAIISDFPSTRPRLSLRARSAGQMARRDRPHPTAAPNQAALCQLNQKLSDLHLPLDLTEPAIEEILQQLERCGGDTLPQHQLLTARLLEAALLCAGRYVDNGEFTAAGDLLVNPRQILIHQKGRSRPLIKIRHGRLSDQLGQSCRGRGAFLEWFKRNIVLEIYKPALIPDLLQRLENFESFQELYLDSVRLRMNKAAQAIGFLATCQVSEPADQHAWRQSATPQMRSFIEAHLCRFDDQHFYRLGLEIACCSGTTGFKSHYLAPQMLNIAQTAAAHR